MLALLFHVPVELHATLHVANAYPVPVLDKCHFPEHKPELQLLWAYPNCNVPSHLTNPCPIAAPFLISNYPACLYGFRPLAGQEP